jgi:uncharacterized membrane protein YkvI
MEGIVIGVIVFLVIYALIKAFRKIEHADEIDDMPWPHGK